MGRITCKDCGKAWVSKEKFDEEPGCDRGWCRQINTDGEEMGRVKRRSRPAHIETPPAVAKQEETAAKPAIKMQVHKTTSQVLSSWEKDKPQLVLIIPDAININIFPRG